MCEPLVHFRSPEGGASLALPFALDALLDDWASLRGAMARHLPEAFQRDEWAYLIGFLEREHLAGVFRGSFGERAPARAPRGVLLRPRGTVAVWLPNNVSLLGPLTAILLGLSGNRLLLKGGSAAVDLTGAFLAFLEEHLRPGPLRAYLERDVSYEVFDREDARNARYAARADVRIVFGSDAAAEAVEALPHPLGSTGFAFVDRRSEAWLAPASVDEELLDTLVKVFGIYGQAGCTSPRRAVLVGGDTERAVEVRDALVERWPRVVRGTSEPHVASTNVMAWQWARALGWDARLVPGHGALFATGPPTLEPFDAPMGLSVVALALDEAVAALPGNIQTVGHAAGDTERERWLAALARTPVKRFVPLAHMHHFGPVWDGTDFWRRTFEEVEVEG